MVCEAMGLTEDCVVQVALALGLADLTEKVTKPLVADSLMVKRGGLG